MRHLRSDYDPIQDPSGKIGDDEPVFVLRANDPAAPASVRAWADAAEEFGSDPAMCQRVREWSVEMDIYRTNSESAKLYPDVPEGALR